MDLYGMALPMPCGWPGIFHGTCRPARQSGKSCAKSEVNDSWSTTTASFFSSFLFSPACFLFLFTTSNSYKTLSWLSFLSCSYCRPLFTLLVSRRRLVSVPGLSLLQDFFLIGLLRTFSEPESFVNAFSSNHFTSPPLACLLILPRLQVRFPSRAVRFESSRRGALHKDSRAVATLHLGRRVSHPTAPPAQTSSKAVVLFTAPPLTLSSF